MVSIGIIGRNTIVDMMLEAAEQVPEFVPTAIYSRTEEGAREFAEKHKLRLIFTDVEEMASSPDIDAVYIASPIGLHYQYAKLFLEHGKHVLCEKTATVCTGELEELIRLAREKNLVFLEAMRLVFQDVLDVVKNNLYKVGRLHLAAFEYARYAPRYDIYLAGKYTSNFDPELCNAAILDLGCYCIHSLIYLFGAPEKVAAQSTFLENGFESTGIVLMKYPDFNAQAVFSKVTDQVRPTALMGEKGAICIDDITCVKRVWFQSHDGEIEDLGYQEKVPNDLMYELREFCFYVESGTQPEKRNQDSILTLRVIDEARRQAGTVFPRELKNRE